MRFHDPSWLWALAAVPVLALIGWRGVGRSAAMLRTLVNERLAPVSMTAVQRRRIVVLAVALACLTVALARPQYGVKPVQVKRSGIDLMILLDVSKSMAARDVKPSRIERARNEMEKLISALEGNRIGIIAFAGASFVECPLTLDVSTVRMFLDSIDVGAIPVPGTNIGSALQDAVKAFASSKAKTKAAIIITDGENLEGSAEDDAKAAAEAGLTVFTIGIGSEAGAPIPELDSSGAITGYKTDEKGDTILTRLDTSTLRSIADAGGGGAYFSQGGRLDLSGLLSRLKRMEKTDIASQEFTEYEDRYQPLLLVAVAALALELLFSLRLAGAAIRPDRA